MKQLPDDTRIKILDKFKHRCIFPISGTSEDDMRLCFRTATDVHEIYPRSRRPKDWNEEENRVPLCREHHDMYHRFGQRHRLMVLLARKIAEKFWKDEND